MQSLFGALTRVLFLATAALLALGLMLLGLGLAALFLLGFGLRRLLARLGGRPQPRRPDFDFARQWSRRARAGLRPRPASGEVVEAEVRELS